MDVIKIDIYESSDLSRLICGLSGEGAEEEASVSDEVSTEGEEIDEEGIRYPSTPDLHNFASRRFLAFWDPKLV